MHAHIADQYLSLLKKSVLDELYIENEARLAYYGLCAATRSAPDLHVVRDIAHKRPDIVQRLRDARAEGGIAFVWPVIAADGTQKQLNLRNISEFYHSMIGRKRLDNIQLLIERVLADRVPGDLIETGVWRGGATVFMRGVLAARGVHDRTVWVADSFAGLPVPSDPHDAGHDFSATRFPILAISRAEVEDLFRRYDLLDERVRFLEGWFKDTLPSAPISKLALMRLDGDLYESTMDALRALYARLAPGGFVIVDDYHDFEPCRRAVDEFRTTHGISSPLEPVDWTCVWWQKE